MDRDNQHIQRRMGENRELQTLSLGTIFWTFLKIGAVTFGGGFAMIALLRQELVERKQWLTSDEFLENISTIQIVPGAVAVNVAFYTGSGLRGLVGGLAAAVGVAVPSFVIILLIAAFAARFQDLPTVQKAFSGIRPVVIGLILASAYRIGRRALDISWKYLVAAFGLGLLMLTSLHPVFVILAGAVAGIILSGKTDVDEREQRVQSNL